MRPLPPALVLVVLAACGDPDPSDDRGGDPDTEVPVETDLGPDLDADGVPAALDCDDGNPVVHPGAVEACNGADDDCDGRVDRADQAFPGALGPFGHDRDVDGYGTDEGRQWACRPPDGDWSLVLGDCDDADPNRRPDVAEICDGVDDDCDGLTDADDPGLVIASSPGAVFRYPDADHDGFGTSEGRWSCAEPGVGWAAAAGDCDDARAAAHPGATETWYDGVDADCDARDDWDQDGDGYAAPTKPGGGTDCVDADAAVHPGRPEVPYNGVDDDCQGGDLCDVDRDGVAAAACGGTDCADGDAARAPGLAEVCDGRDNDCDTLVDQDDPGLPAGLLTTLWADADRDGYGDPATSQASCAATRTGFVGNALDCAPADATRHPGAVERCDLADDDCDGLVDDADPDVVAETWGRDLDLDGWPVADTLVELCAQPASGWARYAGRADCDDEDDRTFPGAAPDDSATACTTDADLDGYGGEAPAPGVTAGSDCDDLDDAAYPGAPETFYDGVDQDCDPGDEYDADGDGFDRAADGGDDCDDTRPSVHPGAVDVPRNGIDEDCSGTDATQVRCTIDFEAAYQVDGEGGDPTGVYGAWGLTFTVPEGFGLIGGDAHGDPGNWSTGTSVPDAAWGLWASSLGPNVIAFDTPVSDPSFVLSGNDDVFGDDVEVRALLGVTVVDSGRYAVWGSRPTIELTGTIDRLELSRSSSNGAWAWVVDDLAYDAGASACPP